MRDLLLTRGYFLFEAPKGDYMLPSFEEDVTMLGTLLRKPRRKSL